MGAGGGGSYTLGTGATTALFGFGTPSASGSVNFTSSIGSVPPAIFNVNIPAIPQGVPTMSIGEGLSTWDEIQ
jgi:hypothetical protein